MFASRLFQDAYVPCRSRTLKHSGELCSPAVTRNEFMTYQFPHTSPAFQRGMGVQRDVGTEACRALWAKQAGGMSGIARSSQRLRLCEFPGESPTSSLWAQRSAFPGSPHSRSLWLLLAVSDAPPRLLRPLDALGSDPQRSVHCAAGNIFNQKFGGVHTQMTLACVLPVLCR